MMEKWKAGSLAAAGAMALLLLFLVLGAIGYRPSSPAPPPATPAPTASADPAVVEVNGQAIGVNAWVEALRVDQAMSALAGVAPPDAEATLERLINGALLLQAVPQPPPEAQAVTDYRAAILAQWGADEARLQAALEAAGLQPGALDRALEHLLRVEQAQESLAAQGIIWEDWIAQQRSTADILYHRERIEAVVRTLAIPTAPAPTPTAVAMAVSPDTAPDFTLERVGGGQFTLSEQLAQGPVVLVFFQRCG